MSELTDNDAKIIKIIVDETSDAVVRKLTSQCNKNIMGKWISSGTQDNMIGDDYKCSICNEEFILDNNFNYCPNCGAKMEREEK